MDRFLSKRPRLAVSVRCSQKCTSELYFSMCIDYKVAVIFFQHHFDGFMEINFFVGLCIVYGLGGVAGGGPIFQKFVFESTEI